MKSQNNSDNRFWLIAVGVIAAVLLLPKILGIVIQIMTITLLATAVALITLGILRIIGVKVDLSSISDKLNSLFGLKNKARDEKNSIGECK